MPLLHQSDRRHACTPSSRPSGGGRAAELRGDPLRRPGLRRLGCFGNPTIKTPCLDRLASEGLKLTACYAAAPVCSPSRTGMLTGRTPNRVGVYDWIPDGSPMHVPRSEITVATLLARSGYDTCHVGKWHCNGRFNSPEQPQPSDHGFAHWFSTQNNAAPSHHNPVNFVRDGRPRRAAGGLLQLDRGRRGDPAGSRTSATRGRPFCLFVWYPRAARADRVAREVHQALPRRRPSPARPSTTRNVSQMDSQVGRLMDALDELKLRDNTFVFFTSDNGPETLDRYRGSWRSHGTPGPLRGMKLWLYEGGIRVPGIVRWPGKTRAGRGLRRARLRRRRVADPVRDRRRRAADGSGDRRREFPADPRRQADPANDAALLAVRSGVGLGQGGACATATGSSWPTTNSPSSNSTTSSRTSPRSTTSPPPSPSDSRRCAKPSPGSTPRSSPRARRGRRRSDGGSDAHRRKNRDARRRPGSGFSVWIDPAHAMRRRTATRAARPMPMSTSVLGSGTTGPITSPLPTLAPIRLPTISSTVSGP